jgi:hypothetical protein
MTTLEKIAVLLADHSIPFDVLDGKVVAQDVGCRLDGTPDSRPYEFTKWSTLADVWVWLGY